jgi:serine/threonine protein kinase
MSFLSFGEKSFNVLKKLGKGSYGNVYLVEENGTKYALKVIPTSTREGIRSLRELDIMSRLSHPYLMNAKTIVASINGTNNEETQKMGILMDLAERDLHTAMYDKSLSFKERLIIMKQVTLGLQFLHQENYLHLDIKPLNILLFKGNIGKLSDFGLALRTEDGKYKNYPLEIVTVSHRSYNILKGDRHYTAADDIWALGMTLFEVLSGGYSLFSELSDENYISKNVLRIIEEKLAPSNIDRTLNRYFSHFQKKTRFIIISLIKRMLSFDVKLRPTTNEILSSPLFANVKIIAYPEILKTPINKPIVCNELVYEGFDVLVRLSTRIPIKLETFFLAADIYQRSLAYRQPITGNWTQDYANTVFQSCLSLYMAIKMIESYFADINVITQLAGNLFSPKYLIVGESILVNSFGGKIYPDNFFTNSTTFERLEEGFNLSRDCHIYSKINFVKWKSLNDSEANEVKDKKKIYENKWGEFIPFLIQTKYYTHLTDATLSYIPILFAQDLNRKL